MLEKVKPGDLCIFSNGDEARVADVNISSLGNYNLYFDVLVKGTPKGPEANWWTYRPDGVLCYSTDNTCINIVKVIAE